MVLDVAIYFEQYVLPTVDAEVVVIDATTVVPEGAPTQIAEGIPIARRSRMERSDFLRFGYTGGCHGRVHFQVGLTGSRNHSQVC